MTDAFRPLFFQAGPVWLFYILAALAVALFALGLYLRIDVWRRGRGSLPRPSLKKAWSNFVQYGLLGRRIWRGDPLGGLAHSAILSGFVILLIGTALLAVHDYLVSFLSGYAYLIYSFVLDLFGLLFVVGLVLALIRRYVVRRAKMERGGVHLATLGLLLLVALTGFWVEGIRLAGLRPPWSEWSFVGHAVAGWLGARPPMWLAALAWWVHALLALALIAWLPWAKLRHSLLTPLAVALAAADDPEYSVEELDDMPGEFFRTDLLRLDACTACNRCETVCPSFLAGEPWSPRQFLRRASTYVYRKYSPLNRIGYFKKRNAQYLDQNITIDPDAMFWCTTCAACQEECPALLTPLSLVGQVRAAIIEDGTKVPVSVAEALESITKFQNPWQRPPQKRLEWADDLRVPEFDPGSPGQTLFFAGCTSSFDTRAQAIPRALHELLTMAGVDFGVLGPEEPCCGDVPRRLGEMGLFEMLVEDNSELLGELKPGRVVTCSPHCAYTMSADYPRLLPKLDIEADLPPVVHYTEFLDEIIATGLVAPTLPVSRLVTFHDPCYLGRRMGVYDPPRRILASLKGARLIEMKYSRQRSVCCGGGGGRMWVEPGSETSMAVIRAEQAVQTGADMLVTACPWCLVMLTDAVKSAGLEQNIEVVDLAELVRKAIA